MARGVHISVLYLLISIFLCGSTIAQSPANSDPSASQSEATSESAPASVIATTFPVETFATDSLFVTSLPSRTGASATVTVSFPLQATDVAIQEAYVINATGGKYLSACWYPVSVCQLLPILTEYSPRS